jgi:hypothetical protein
MSDFDVGQSGALDDGVEACAVTNENYRQLRVGLRGTDRTFRHDLRAAVSSHRVDSDSH